MNSTNQFVNVRELEEMAEKLLTQNAFLYYRSGANEQLTKQDNLDAFRRIKLHPRVMRDVSQVCTKTTILSHPINLPFGVAPSAMLKLSHPEGELTPAQVTGEKCIPYTLSSLSTTSLEDVARANGNGFRFFQLYIQKNRSLTEDLVKLAEKNNYSGIVVTVDAPILGKREAEERFKFKLPENMRLEVFEAVARKHQVNLSEVSSDTGSGLLQFFAKQIDPSITWADIKWLKTITKLPIIVKGIQSWQDALLARDAGVAAVWVSNHGGRQLDTVRASVDMVPEVIQVLKGSEIEVYCDGGVRSGTDIFKCLALGVRCVFFGRPVLYSTAVGQKKGFERLVEILEQELKTTMQLCGVTKISDINEDYIVKNTIPKPNL